MTNPFYPFNFTLYTPNTPPPTMKPSLLAALAALLLPLAAFAAGNEIVSVAAKGYGTTPEAARLAAGRAAIEQVVGQLVDAETLVENDELVKDKILAYSAAVLDGVEAVGKPQKTEDGLFCVSVLARVRKTKIVERLKTGNVPVKIGSEFSDVVDRVQSAKDREEGARAMLEKVFRGFPHNLVKAEPVRGRDGRLFEIDRSKGENEVVATVDVSIDPVAYGAWAKDLMQKLDEIAESHEDRVVKIDKERYGDARGYPSQGILDVDFDEDANDGKPCLAVCKPVRKSANSAVVRSYYFPKPFWRSVVEPLLKRVHASDCAIRLSLYDEDDELVGSSEPAEFLEETDSYRWHWKSPCLLECDYSDRWMISPFFRDDESTASFRMKLSLGTYDPEDLKDIVELKRTFVFKNEDDEDIPE